MAILIGKDTRLITQGITGKAGLFHSQKCREYGTNVVGGVTPKKGGTTVDGFPVFNSVAEAVKETGANATMIFVPAPYAGDAILEAADAGVQLIVAITEGIPVMDMLKVHNYLKGKKLHPHRAQLPRGDHRRRLQDRHRPRPHPQQGQDRHRLPLGHPDL